MREDGEPATEEDDEPATEGDVEWRERVQETEELAERLQPPHETHEDGTAPAEPRLD